MTAPFLKWAGGKRWLAPELIRLIGKAVDSYVEPFLGGGAVFFALRPRKAVLSDLNGELINLYQCVRDYPQEIEQLLVHHQAAHSKEHYYRVRSEVPTTELRRAARMLYLNRTCYNGLYRVNQKGEFNVPIGTKTKVFDEAEDLCEIAEALRMTQIKHCDFEDTIDATANEDLLFVDPPYTAKHNENGFLKYNETIFSWADQIRLYASVKRAAERGVRVVVTNADHHSLRELYVDFNYRSLNRPSVLSGKAAARGATTEALFSKNLWDEICDRQLIQNKGEEASAKTQAGAHLN